MKVNDATYRRPIREQQKSIIEAKSKIRTEHDESCDCCCCCSLQPTCYKYVQPQVPKSFAPIRRYWKSSVPLEDNTTYRLSYWECPSTVTDAIRPKNWLITGDGEMSEETTYKTSYLDHLCVKPVSCITPCEKQWLGRGPMQDVTTQKHDYTWKCVEPTEPIKARNNLYCQSAPLHDDTTYKLSYFQSNCCSPTLNYAPVRNYTKSDIPLDDHTIYRLSYWPHDTTVKEEPSWCKKVEYLPPLEPVDGCTIYKLSYWPHAEKKRSPTIPQETDNILNGGCCSDNNTTYRLSYFGCAEDKRSPIRQPENITFSSYPSAYDTIHRMSFLGNWCTKQEAPIIPCDKQMLGRGSMQDVTTQKHDYTWKQVPLEPSYRPKNNLVPATSPAECCTTHRLSYIENDYESLTPVQSYAPIRIYNPSDVPMKSETITQLSYQPVEATDSIDKPWSEPLPYYSPITPMENNTTYNTSYIPPGTLVPQL